MSSIPRPPAAAERRIGPHLALGAGLLKAADRAAEIGATAVQIWTDNPTAWRRRAAPPPELDEFKVRLRSAGVVTLAVHAPYLVNLCGANELFWQRSVETMSHELRVAAEYDADLLVMHIGSHLGEGREQGIARLIAGLAAILAEVPPTTLGWPTRLALENSAGAGDGIGARLEDLGDIVDAAVAAGLPVERLGICLDTAHLWGAGYDISYEAGVALLVGRIDALIGRKNVAMLHLNDSRARIGSHLDRHEHIAAGQIGAEGLRAVLTESWLSTLPAILETPGMDSGYDAVNLERARQLIAGDTPAPLPPEAFTLRSSRSRTAPPTP